MKIFAINLKNDGQISCCYPSKFLNENLNMNEIHEGKDMQLVTTLLSITINSKWWSNDKEFQFFLWINEARRIKDFSVVFFVI